MPGPETARRRHAAVVDAIARTCRLDAHGRVPSVRCDRSPRRRRLGRVARMVAARARRTSGLVCGSSPASSAIRGRRCSSPAMARCRRRGSSRTRRSRTPRTCSPNAPARTEAIIALTEAGDRRSYTWDQLRADVAAFAAAFVADGVRPGDRVAAYMPNVAETIITFLAANAIGATFTSTSSDFGVAGVVDRFGQTAADRAGRRRRVSLRRQGVRLPRSPRRGRRATAIAAAHRRRRRARRDQPNVERHPERRALDRLHRAARGRAAARSSGCRAIIRSTSSTRQGTTGKPKCITHRALGVLLMHLKEHQLHCDIRAGDRVMYFTTCGWMMWNWLVSGAGFRRDRGVVRRQPVPPFADCAVRRRRATSG